MSVMSFSRADLAERQAAFTGLLAHPLLAPWTDPVLCRLVLRHEHTLEVWCARLGYRLVRIDQCFRLRRSPLDGLAASPRVTPPPRRPLVLALLVAALLEDHSQDSITLQEISDTLRHFAAANRFVPYDPDHRSHRVALVAAVHLLVAHGVLDRRTLREELLQAWERTGGGIGAGYLIHRDALVLLVDTRDVHLALEPADSPDDTRGQRILRQLVETQALHPLSLTDAERTYLGSQRRRLIDQAEEMTGGTVEVRSDAWVLVIPSDQGLDADLVVAFPEATAADWVALALLDWAGSDALVLPDGRRRCPGRVVDELADRLHTEYAGQLTIALRESAGAVREAAETQLTAAGLLSVAESGDWLLQPEAGRYRSAELQLPRSNPSPAETLFEE